MSEEKNEFKETVEEKAEEVKEKAEVTAEKAKETVEEKAAEVKDKAVEVKDKAEDTAKKAAEDVKDTAKKAEAKAEDTAKKVKENVAAKKGLSNQKLIIAVLAACAVVGAIIFAFMSGGSDKIYGVSDFDKYVKLGKYKGIEYTQETIKVSKKDIKTEIDQRLQSKAQNVESKKGKVKDGDNVNISYVGKVDGKEFEGGTAENQTLTIGSHAFIEGFEEGLIGKKVGDKVVLKLKFPKNYSKNAASDEDKKAKKKLDGKDVEFTVTINSKQVTKVPEYDEKFIKENSDYDNKKDYEASVKKDLEKSKKETAKQTAQQSIWSQVLESTEIKKYPKGAVKEEQEKVIEQYKQMAESYNMEWKEFLKTYLQSNEKDFKKQAKTYGESVAKQKLTLHALAKKEKIKVTDKEYKKRLKELLKNANMTEKQFKEQYNMTIEKYAEENDFKTQFLMEKVYDFIYKEGKPVKAKK